MLRGRFTEVQIIGVLREHEGGVQTVDLCRKHRISNPTFYKCKAKYGVMAVWEAARLRTLEREPTPEMAAGGVDARRIALLWRCRRRVALYRAGKSTHNGVVESFIVRMRDDLLNKTLSIMVRCRDHTV